MRFESSSLASYGGQVEIQQNESMKLKATILAEMLPRLPKTLPELIAEVVQLGVQGSSNYYQYKNIKTKVSKFTILEDEPGR